MVSYVQIIRYQKGLEKVKWGQLSKYVAVFKGLLNLNSALTNSRLIGSFTTVPTAVVPS